MLQKRTDHKIKMHRIHSWFSRALNKCDAIHEKHPAFFDIVFKIIGVITAGLSVTSIFDKALFFSISTAVAIVFVLLMQYLKLSSKHRSVVQQINERFYDELNIANEEKFRQSYLLSTFAQRTISDLNTLIFRRNSFEIFEEEFALFLVNSMNRIEDILSEYYKTKFSVCMYLLVKPNALRLFAYGNEYTISRGGQKKVSVLKGTIVRSTDNGAFHQLVVDRLPFFMSNDCQSSLQWHKCIANDFKFQSLLALPIKQPKCSPATYAPISGVLCVDSNENIIEWNYNGSNPEHSFAYNVASFFSEVLSPLCSEYQNQLETRNK